MQRVAQSLVMLALTAMAAPALAQDGDADVAEEDEEFVDRSIERCISLSRIRRTEIIDNQTIAFHLRGGDIYLNSLPRNCPGLSQNDQFMYEVNINRLCDTDWITVIEGFGASRGRGFTCRLGEFSPISEEVLAIMKDATDGSGEGGGGVEMEPLELPESDDDASEAETG